MLIYTNKLHSVHEVHYSDSITKRCSLQKSASDCSKGNQLITMAAWTHIIKMCLHLSAALMAYLMALKNLLLWCATGITVLEMINAQHITIF